MSGYNRTNNNRVNNRNNKVNNRAGSRPGGRENSRPDARTDSRANARTGGRPSDRENLRRNLHDYSVDMAAQRGVVREDSAQRRNRKTGDVKVAPVSRNTRSGKYDNADRLVAERTGHMEAQNKRNRNVDVAATRRSSGKVDVETGRRLDGRVRVPVDKRRVQHADEDRHVSRANNRIAEDERRRISEKRRPVDDERRNAPSKRRLPEDDRHRRKDNKKSSNKKADRRPVKQKKRKPTPQEIEQRKRLKQEKLERRKQRREKAARVLRVLIRVMLVVIVIGAIALAVINSSYRLKNIKVSGTDHYTDQQMEEIVTGGRKIKNTLFFLLNNRINPPGDVTFIDKIDVSYVNRNTISIMVYEKAMAGCIKTGDKYAYFDGDGIVLEISDKKLDDVPCIEGITSDSVEQGKKLTVGDNSFFQEVLTMTQLILKNNIQIDKITYDDKQNLILHKDGIKIKIGNADNLESKFMNLENILSTLKGKKGTLDMSNYSASDGSVIFKENK